MEKEHFERLEEDYIFLSKCMMKNTKLFVNFLTEEQMIMDGTDAEDILDEVSHFKRAQKMLDYVMKRNDEKAYDALYKGCLHVHLWKAADVLMPENAPHEPDEEEDVVEHLPEVWPSESHFDLIKEPTRLTVRPSGPTMRTRFQQCAKADSTMYNLNHRNKGRLLIIDNEKFKSKSVRQRTGSTYDRKGLSYLFSNLGFEVRQEENMTKKEMWDFMKSEVNKIKEIGRCNCFAIAILSYGFDGNNGVFGTDGIFDEKNKEKCDNYITVKEIKELFTLEQLTGKPKIFLIVAQQAGQYRQADIPRTKKDSSAQPYQLLMNEQGRTDPNCNMKKDEASGIDGPYYEAFPKRLEANAFDIPMPSATYLSDHFEKLTAHSGPFRSGLTAKAKDIGRITLSDNLEEMDGPEETEKIPKDADIFQAVVTPKEMMLHHEMPVGTWFIQAFIFVMSNYSHQKDLREVFEKVNELIAHQATKRADRREIEHCMANFTANKKLYFFPGLHAEE